ncbi:MAG: Uma2 family endonuclease [Myxacorys californica WJT36-NPBG1]|jgi:Uma2 family endonuclease|nr:Uma2 family endonuclease [Myxacorys californica WJT36-NPBG1]
MVQTPIKPITLEEFLKLPETKPASEYVNDQVIQRPMPQGKHSKLQKNLIKSIDGVVEEPKIAQAFPELRCTFGGRSTVPDVAVFTWARIPLDEDGNIANVFTSAPDWTIEILPPDQSPTRVTSNIVHCLRHGTQLGWLIDPAEKLLLVYATDQLVAIFEVETDVLPVPGFAKELQLTLGDLFGWLKV